LGRYFSSLKAGTTTEINGFIVVNILSFYIIW
jgi:hypothetical protein